MYSKIILIPVMIGLIRHNKVGALQVSTSFLLIPKILAHLPVTGLKPHFPFKRVILIISNDLFISKQISFLSRSLCNIVEQYFTAFKRF